jgi:kynurenine formamidase
MSRFIDLSHMIVAGMTTYKGLPGPAICDYWTREESARNFSDGSTFQMGRIDMVSNTGTYLDAPFHRFAEGDDLSALRLSQVADLPGLVVRHRPERGLAVDADVFADIECAGRAVLVETGWSRHWGTETYLTEHPFLTAAAAELLVARGAALVGIDSHNIDDTRGTTRPVHRILLGADILICEHMTGLSALPDNGFRFTAAPPKICGMGTFPVRAFAVVEGR